MAKRHAAMAKQKLLFTFPGIAGGKSEIVNHPHRISRVESKHPRVLREESGVPLSAPFTRYRIIMRILIAPAQLVRSPLGLSRSFPDFFFLRHIAYA